MQLAKRLASENLKNHSTLLVAMERKKEERNTTESVMLLEQNSSADMVKIMED